MKNHLTKEWVEASYYYLSDDIVVVFNFADGRLEFSIALVDSGFIVLSVGECDLNLYVATLNAV